MKTKRIYSLSRIVALAVIGVMLLGLTYLGMASGDAAVSVSQGAHAGQLTMHPCTYATEKGAYRADCGTLIVPEDRANPRSRLIALPVTRILARSSHPLAPIFHLNGGPGITNMTFPQADRLALDHDVVMLGYRGVDGSSVLNCPEVTAALDVGDQVKGPLARFSSAAVGDGHEGGRERLEVAQRVRERGGLLVGLGREELEGPRGTRGEQLVDSH